MEFFEGDGRAQSDDSRADNGDIGVVEVSGLFPVAELHGFSLVGLSGSCD